MGGLNITGLAPLYLANPADARLAIPLDVGLGSLSPVSVTVRAGNVTRQFDYNYVDFGADRSILVNTAQDNRLNVTRYDGTLTGGAAPGVWRGCGAVRCRQGGGRRVRCRVHAGHALKRRPGHHRIQRVGRRCVGRSAGIHPGEKADVGTALSSNLAGVALFVLALPVVYWAYSTVKNRR